MAEAIHCPSCSTRYRLRPQRLKPAIRRAKCFTCGGVFPVGDIVQRLLALPAEIAPAGISTEDLGEALGELSPGFLPPLEAFSPSLTPGDLEGGDAEILEKTLVVIPTFLPEAKAQVLPEPAPLPAAPTPFPSEITETTLSGYTSARDAIEKLFGTAPIAPTGSRIHPEPSSMDLEATLSALDSTLGGTPPTPTAATGTLGDSPTASGLTEEDLAGPSSSTMRLSQEDLQAVRATASKPVPAPSEPTVALRASDLLTATAGRTESVPAFPSSRSFAPPADGLEGGSELLRLKTGEDIYSGLTMPQLIAWVNEGRILENHLVARQHSENWLEAHKVPGLRPVFERLRRERSGGAPSLDSSLGEVAPRKSLFGGLFGKS